MSLSWGWIILPPASTKLRAKYKFHDWGWITMLEHSSVFRCQCEFASLTARQVLFWLVSWGNGSEGANMGITFTVALQTATVFHCGGFKLGVTSAESPSRWWCVISYTNKCQNCSFPNKKTLRWHEHGQTDASAEIAVEEAQSHCIMRCLWY